jgi:Flp pilus assembly protein TadG
MMPLFAVTLPVLILLCGLSIDLGRLELQEQRMQTAADAAAISAELEAERGTGNWAALGKQDASQNGFTDGQNNTTVNVVQFANYGAWSGRYDGLQVTITQQVKTLFMGALNGGYVTAKAQSVAQITPCIYTLGTGSLQNVSLIVYTGSLLGDSCPVYSTNINVQSNGHVAVEAVNVSGSPGSSTESGFVYPSPLFNVPVVTDPLAYVTSPSFSSCTRTGYSVTSGSATLNPGTYCKGLNISNANVTLNPGLYIITGGATWSNATVSGNGVTLFFTTGGGGGYGQFLIQNGSNVTISAANDSSNGAIPAILVFADRNWTATGAQDFQLISSTMSGDGIWYIPHAGLEVWSSGTYTAPHYLGVVADNIFSAGTYFEPVNNYSYVATGNPFRTQAPVVQ